VKDLVKRACGYLKYKKQLKQFKQSAAKTRRRFDLKPEDYYPRLDDNTVNTEFDRHYVYHLAWAARVVREINPTEHIDIASLLHFPAILSAFIKVKYYDYRPAQLRLDNFSSETGDLTGLPFQDNCLASLSCMHTVEHVGLGRYGDPVDYDGDLKAIKELKRVVARNGSLLFVVPVGKARIQFNAHRIYSYDQIVTYFEGFKLKEFSLIPDSDSDGGLVTNAPKELCDRQLYGCGCFWLVKQ
jgi:SAM-dependent methyltransferase